MSKVKVSKFHTCLYGICLLSLAVEYLPRSKKKVIAIETNQSFQVHLIAQNRSIYIIQEDLLPR